MAIALIYASVHVFIRVRDELLDLGTWRLLR